MIQFDCESCFQEYKVRDDRAGQTLKCKSCGSKMRVPAGEDDLLDDLYEEDFESPVRPARSRKSSSGSSKKKKSSGSGSNVVGIIAGVGAFAVAFFISYTVVKGLFPGEENQEQPADVAAETQPKEAPVQPAAEAVTSNAVVTPTDATPVDSTPIPDDPKARSEELNRLRKQMTAYSESMKTTTDAEERKATVDKMKTTLARIKQITSKQKEETAAQNNSTKPATPTKPEKAEQVWTSMVDPPVVTAEWPESSRLKIDLKNVEEKLIVPNCFSPFAGLLFKGRDPYQLEIWNLATEKKISQISISTPQNWIVLLPTFKLSADGKFLLLSVIERDSKVPRMISWETATGKIAAEWDVDLPNSTVSTYAICGNQWAFAKFIRKEGTKYKSIFKRWDLKTGELLQEAEINSGEFMNGSYQISPGGNFLVSFFSSKMNFYDLKTLKMIYELNTEGNFDPRAGHYSIQGMDFSVDGKELGVLLTESNRTEVWTINLENCKPERRYQVDGELREQFSEPSYAGNNLILTPSGKSFLLFGALLVDRQSQRNVWLFQPVPHVIMRNPLYLTPHYLFAGTDSALTDARGRILMNRKPRLITVPLPEKEIMDSLAAYNSKTTAILGSGTKVSIDINVGNIKFGKADEVKEVLHEVLQQRLESDGLEVADDQPLVFKIEYQEQAGNKLQMTKRGAPAPGNPLGRTATGETLQSTAAEFKISWIDKSTKRTIWSKEVLVNPRFLILRNATEQEAREKMFEGLQNRLMGELIPYFIPTEKGLSMLPGETQLPE